MSSDNYIPPYELTDEIIHLISEISELIGRYSVLAEASLTPQLRRENRIKTIQASLQIENNSLSLGQVTAVLEGKRVLGLPKEIQEVQNAFSAYDLLEGLNPNSVDDLLLTHQTLMQGLAEDAGRFRQGGVGIYQGEKLVHMAPPAHLVRGLMQDLLDWLERSSEHPLVRSCVFHYEFEFIHPFSDGNGRMGRLWQTLILKAWKPLLAYLPVETLIYEQQQDYYDALAKSDHASDAGPFIVFMLKALKSALEEAQQSDQVSDQLSDQVKRLLAVLSSKELKAIEIMNALGLSHRPSFRKNYLNPALEQGLIERTHPDNKNSPQQRYRIKK